MLNRKLSVGSNIDTWCGSCKAERGHTVAAIDPDGTVSRVTCAHCGSYHRYRATTATTSGARSRRATPASQAAIPAAQRVVHPYQRSQRYAVGDLIEHPKYGRGTVTGIAAPTKIKVKFPDGEHTLLQATE